MNGKPYGKGQGQGGNRQQGNNQGSGGQGGQSIEKITAPYNFVPLSKKVFFPDWAGQVSHDVPFVDGISGELECELTTHTPIYVRNGGLWRREEGRNDYQNDKEAQSFFYVKEAGEPLFMIPGTSLKGMLRNVVEIASFGKMCRVDDARYSVRDLNHKTLYMNRMKHVKAGWLVLSDDKIEWEIIPCDYALINHDLLGKPGLKEKQDALSKYTVWGGKLDVRFDYKETSTGCRATKIGAGDSSGTLVFTGQPVRNDGGKFKKRNEFIFFEELKNKRLSILPRLREDIGFIYTNPNSGKPYKEWDHWQSVLNGGGRVPVFYQMNGENVGSFGFTRLYRLPYTNSVKMAIKNTSSLHGETDLDLPETIFGFVDNNRGATKGRVNFSPAVAVNGTVKPYDKEIQTVLGAPKPTFYPNYIDQPHAIDGKVQSDHKTFMDGDCQIRGWKRYPVRPIDKLQPPKQGTDKVDSWLIPLKAGAHFKFRVKVHNLKPAELGAVAWSLTWGNNPQLRHSLGMGKSMGFGVADIKIKSANLRDMADTSVDWQGCMREFVKLMDHEVGGGWLKTAQMEQLLAMADPTVKPQCGELKHMDLAKRDFQEAKKKLRLEPHVKPSAIADEVRFKDLTLRSQKATAPMAPPAAASQIPQTVLPSSEETWPQVRLSFNRGPRILQAQAPDGRRAEVQLSGSTANLVAEDVLNAIPKNKTIPAVVTVEKLGPKWRITGVKLV